MELNELVGRACAHVEPIVHQGMANPPADVQRAMNEHASLGQGAHDPRVRAGLVTPFIEPIVRAALHYVLAELAQEGVPILDDVLSIEQGRHPSVNWNWLRNLDNMLRLAGGMSPLPGPQPNPTFGAEGTTEGAQPPPASEPIPGHAGEAQADPNHP
jgi:hypothetical protein